jgi:cyanophycin synthetase
MLPLWRNRILLKALHLHALARAYFRYRNPRRRQSGAHLSDFYERAWREAASALGASYEPLGGGIAEIARDGVRTRVTENTCPIDDPVTLAIASDKALTYRLLDAEGLPVPRHASFHVGALETAAAFLDATRRDCVVKPAGGTGGGRGVTTGIRSRWHLARAAAAASVYADDLLIEEQVEGDNYRLLYLDGVLLDAFVRTPPTVAGDGRSTVAQLVAQANDERLRERSGVSQVLLTVDLDMQRTLAKQGLSLGSVPAAGRAVVLKNVVNENRGADNATATGRLSDAVVAEGARAARAVGVRLAGIDLITPDPTVPLAEAGGVVLEVNTPPNYYFHYHKRDGAFPVALAVLDRLLGAEAAALAQEASRP